MLSLSCLLFSNLNFTYVHRRNRTYLVLKIRKDIQNLGTCLHFLEVVRKYIHLKYLSIDSEYLGEIFQPEIYNKGGRHLLPYNLVQDIDFSRAHLPIPIYLHGTNLF